jgi:hypothetical protein
MNNAIEILRSEMTGLIRLNKMKGLHKIFKKDNQRTIDALDEALLALEIKEQYEKSIDSILNLANTIMDDSTDGNTIIRTLCDSGLELEQGKDYEWKRKGELKYA